MDFKKASVDMTIHPQKTSVSAGITYEFEILQNTDSIYLDIKNVVHQEIVKKSFKAQFYQTEDKFIFKGKFTKGETHSLSLFVVTNPKTAMYFIDWNEKEGNKQIWTQGQGKYTSNWLPSLDDVNDKIAYDFTITFNKEYEVIANGKLIKKEVVNDSLVKWRYYMKQPMSSYLVGLAIGKYQKKTVKSTSGIPIEMYYYPEDEAKFEPTYRYTQRIFDFLEDEIGVAYPWQNYKQIPVKDFLYAGMENTGTTIFSDSFVVDSIGFVDKNYVNINAHELAHQWFGNLVTAKSGKHHWLQEGFATYYALLAEKELFGNDYFHWKLFVSAMQLKALNNGKGEALLNPSASSLTFYQKGAWALHVLRTKVGEKAFKKAVQRYLNMYKFGSAETNDFIRLVEKESGQNLSEFVQTWLVNPQLPDEFYSFEHVLTQNSKESENMYTYLGGIKSAPAQVSGFRKSIEKESTTRISEKIANIIEISQNELVKAQHPVADEVIINLVKNIPKDTSSQRIRAYKEAFKINHLKVRQAIAETLTQIPLELKTEYESLLQDASYVTKEAALYNLWVNFPLERKKYLDQTKNSYGFHDRSFRILWLTLAIVTKGYSGHDTPVYYTELSNYTLPQNHFEVRQNAFVFINELRAFTDQNLADLVNGAMHHNWRFAKFCRDMLDTLLANPDYKENFVRVQKILSVNEVKFLEKRMKS
ncbi:M1 family metallopeptidase [Kordia zhangzhouensis]|uniref:M1 family metallopeptidase n=1 Tax=Kordia zhangzhouensis TaxID=1620405 RepID=UPI001F4C6179|nr:M1 family metallopeptidase [Kordia zhangzhouensis]